jgi:hypothetical protein
VDLGATFKAQFILKEFTVLPAAYQVILYSVFVVSKDPDTGIDIKEKTVCTMLKQYLHVCTYKIQMVKLCEHK